MHVNEVLARIQSSLGLGSRYKLGKGGMNPGSPTPNSGGQCDCSGYVSWCLGMSRKTTQHFYVNFNGGWIETTAAWTDIGSSVGIFDSCTKKPGAIIVYPDANGRQGHIGILVDSTHVAHCSKGNDTQFGNAIQITPLTVFANNGNSRTGWLYGLLT
jgi:hypothetical protein